MQGTDVLLLLGYHQFVLCIVEMVSLMPVKLVIMAKLLDARLDVLLISDMAARKLLELLLSVQSIAEMVLLI